MESLPKSPESMQKSPKVWGQGLQIIILSQYLQSNRQHRQANKTSKKHRLHLWPILGEFLPRRLTNYLQIFTVAPVHVAPGRGSAGRADIATSMEKLNRILQKDSLTRHLLLSLRNPSKKQLWEEKILSLAIT